MEKFFLQTVKLFFCLICLLAFIIFCLFFASIQNIPFCDNRQIFCCLLLVFLVRKVTIEIDIDIDHKKCHAEGKSEMYTRKNEFAKWQKFNANRQKIVCLSASVWECQSAIKVCRNSNLEGFV